MVSGISYDSDALSRNGCNIILSFRFNVVVLKS